MEKVSPANAYRGDIDLMVSLEHIQLVGSLAEAFFTADAMAVSFRQ